ASSSGRRRSHGAGEPAANIAAAGCWWAPTWLCRLAAEPMRGRTLQSTLDQRAGELIGRESERAALLELVERDRPLVAFVHGIAGVGKSTLLQAAAVDARARGTLVIAL